jgi:signal transduction histidine kinase
MGVTENRKAGHVSLLDEKRAAAARHRRREHMNELGDKPDVQLSAASLEERLQIEQLLSDLSTRFSSLLEEQVDGEIEMWMRRLADMLGADRSSFAELVDGGFRVTHSYAAPGIDPYPKGLADAALPWLTSEFAAGRTVVLPNLPDDLPAHATAERTYFAAAGMRSGIGIPVKVGGAVVCVLTFGAFRQSRTWPPEVIARLRLAGDTFGNAISRRATKQQLFQKHLELVHLARVAAMGELASVIAHELDQPLTAVVSNAEAVRHMLRQKRPDVAGADDALIDVIDAAMRMSEIVKRERKLLRKSRDDFEDVDVNEAVHEIELFIRAEARHDGAKLKFELQPGLPPVHGDRVQLQQVILNLARNALQAMRERPREQRHLKIQTLSSTDAVTLSVTDTGPGIEESVLSRMFDPFFTTKPDGLGMGLSISKSIVDAHRGRIRADRNPARGGGGLTVHVTVPRK